MNVLINTMYYLLLGHKSTTIFGILKTSQNDIQFTIIPYNQNNSESLIVL